MSVAAALFPPCAGSGLRLGLGGAPLGNLFAAISEAQARATLDAAWSSGCRSFDTAPHYGHGLSERRMGDALRERPREAFVLSSKVGRLLRANPDAARDQHGYVDGLPFDQQWDYSAGGVRRSIEDSLERTGLERIDVAFVHDCDAATHGAQAGAVLRQVLDETLPTLHRMKGEGTIRAVGLGVNQVAVVLEVLREGAIDALLLAGRYSLLDQSGLPDLLPLCRARGVHVALGGIFNSGLLATGTRHGTPMFDYAPARREWIRRTALIEALCAAHDVPLRAAALQFVLAQPAVESVLLGARDPQQWHDAQVMLNVPIPPVFWPALQVAGLLPIEAPVP